MEFLTTGGSVLPLPKKSQARAYCVLWLDTQVDHEPKVVKLPIFVTDKIAWFTQSDVGIDLAGDNTGKFADVPRLAGQSSGLSLFRACVGNALASW